MKKYIMKAHNKSIKLTDIKGTGFEENVREENT